MSIIGTPLLKFYKFTVTIEPWTGQSDDMNKPIYGPACPYLAKIERQERILREDNQTTIRSRRWVYLYTTDTSISTKDRITLPVGFEPRQPKILDVRSTMDHNGIHHMVIAT